MTNEAGGTGPSNGEGEGAATTQDDDPLDISEISFDNVRYTWDLYFKSIHVVMLIFGVTIAFIANVAFVSESGPTMTGREYAIAAMIVAAVGGAVALVWRFISQVLCETQLYVPHRAYEDYFRATKTWIPYSLDSSQDSGTLIRLCRWGADICKAVCSLLVLASWLLGLIFFYQNLS